MLEAVVLAQQTRIAFDFTLPAIVSLVAGILILIFPKFLNYIVAAYLIAVGVIELFNIRI